MTADIIDLDAIRNGPEPVVVTTETPMMVLGRQFTERRTICVGSGRGWFTVRGERGKVVFLRMADFPRERVPDLIVAWLDGHGVGRRDALATSSIQPTGDLV